MFSSPEKRTKKESIASKNKQDSNNQSGFDKNENTSSKKLDALDQKSKTHSENSGLARLQEKANNKIQVYQISLNSEWKPFLEFHLMMLR